MNRGPLRHVRAIPGQVLFPHLRRSCSFPNPWLGPQEAWLRLRKYTHLNLFFFPQKIERVISGRTDLELSSLYTRATLVDSPPDQSETEKAVESEVCSSRDCAYLLHLCFSTTSTQLRSLFY